MYNSLPYAGVIQFKFYGSSFRYLSLKINKDFLAPREV